MITGPRIRNAWLNPEKMPSTTTCRSRCQYLYFCTSKCVSICTFVLVTERERLRDNEVKNHLKHTTRTTLIKMTTGKHFRCSRSVSCSSVVPYSSFPCMFGGREREEKKQEIHNRSTSRVPV